MGAKIQNLGVLKTIDHIQIKIKIPNPSPNPGAPSIAPNQDLNDINVHFTFKIKTESRNSEHVCIKDH